MLRRARALFFAIAFALAGAVAGRIASNYREALEKGEGATPAPTPRLDAGVLRLRPRDVLPGLVAALRAGESPWSYLRIPAWLAAFVVNFGFTAFGSELAPLKRMAGFPDLDFFGKGEDDDTIEVRDASAPRPGASTPPMPAWTAEGAPREASAGGSERPGNGQQGSGFTAFPN